jgi:hypothetical protein
MIKLLIICLAGVSSLSATALENGFEINASYDPSSKSVVIKWKNNEQCASQFILQKSDDQQNWVNVDTLYNTEDFNEQMILWEDRNPVPGGFLYRLKTVVDDYNFSFSKPVYVKISPWIYDWSITENIKDRLVLQYAGSGLIEGVINVYMQTRSGKTLFKSRYSSFTTSIDIPVANLGKGNYYITMFVEGELIWKYKLVK